MDHNFMADAARNGLWQQESAWFYGWMLSDGNASKNMVRLSVQRRDRDVVEKIQTLLKSDHKISDYDATSGYNLGAKFPQTRIQLTSSVLVADLAVLGIVPRKTQQARFYPDLLLPYNKHVLCHAIRGLFEGDGTLFWCRTNKCWIWGLYGNESVIRTSQEIIEGIANCPGHIRKMSGSTRVLRHARRSAVRSICESLYTSSLKQFTLDRKARIAHDIINGF